MESNREEAVRCLRLADRYLEQGDLEKAEKFGRKALKLFPSAEAEGVHNLYEVDVFKDVLNFTFPMGNLSFRH